MSGVSAQDRGVLAIDMEKTRYAISLRGEADAVNMCGTIGCEVVATFSSCLGVAHSSQSTRERPVWTWIEAQTAPDARGGALDECTEAGGLACAEASVVCLAEAADRAGAPAAQQPAPAAQQPAPAASAELEGLFWQTIMNSANPADFEAYLAQFPNGVFRALAENRLAAPRAPSGDPPTPADRPAGGVGSRAAGAAVGNDAPLRPGEVFRDCDECPEMVMLPGGRLALGRYEVTVGEYRAYASATGGGAGDDCVTLSDGDSWRNPGFSQMARHPVPCVSWDDVQEYVSWLSRTTGATYRLPTEAEWERAAAGSERGCDLERTGNDGTCPVGSTVPMGRACRTWSAICGSGRRTAGRVTAAPAWCAAAPGSTVPSSGDPAHASGSSPSFGATPSGFGLQGRLTSAAS